APVPSRRTHRNSHQGRRRRSAGEFAASPRTKSPAAPSPGSDYHSPRRVAPITPRFADHTRKHNRHLLLRRRYQLLCALPLRGSLRQGYFFILARNLFHAAMPASAAFSSTPWGNPATPTAPTKRLFTDSGRPPPTR